MSALFSILQAHYILLSPIFMAYYYPPYVSYQNQEVLAMWGYVWHTTIACVGWQASHIFENIYYVMLKMFTFVV